MGGLAHLEDKEMAKVPVINSQAEHIHAGVKMSTIILLPDHHQYGTKRK